MLVIGAKGFAKEILEILHLNNSLTGLAFYDDINKDIGISMYNQFPILKDVKQVKEHFELFGNKFTLGVGNPSVRYTLYEKFIQLGGEFTSTVSSFASIGSYDVSIGCGSNILGNSIFSNSTKIGMGVIVYYNVVITHDCTIGDFVEISPNVQILGRCNIGKMTHIGANSTILPDITVGSNVIIGAGSVVTKDIESNCIAFGTPARVMKKLSPIF